VDGGLQPEKTTINPDPNKLLVAAYNIENFSANPTKTPDSKVKRLAQSIINDLKKPDIITVLELQDNDGPTDSGDADASKSAKRLTDEILAQSGVQYECVNINPNYNEDGGQPGANIRVAYFYRPDRVQLKSGKVGKANDANKWENGHLSLNPGRINPTDTLYDHTRKSLAAEFTFKDKDVLIVANHLNSKRGDDSLYGKKQPVTFKSEAKRLKMAADIKKFVDAGMAQNPNLNVLLTGDFNDFEFSPVIKTFEGSNMHSVIKDYNLGDRYAYYYQGNNQILDNIIVSNNLKGHYEFDIVHVNSSFMEEHGRVSDHDPLLIQLDLQ
jgi:predicted extracellular nuclease